MYWVIEGKGGKAVAKFCFNGSGGSDELCPKTINDVSYHIQTTLNGCVNIPSQKPDSEDIFNVVKGIKINKYKTIVVKRPVGKKVLVSGEVMLGIEYISTSIDQKVHFAHWDIPFNVLIMNNDGSLLDVNFNQDLFIPHVCVEYLDVNRLNERTVCYQMVLLIWLQSISG